MSKRVLKNSSRKQQLRNFFNSPVYGSDACPLCEYGETPPNLNLHIQDSSNSKTCGDVHLELSLIKQSTQPDLCDAKQQLYRTKCCPEGGMESSTRTAGVGTALGLLIVLILIKRILSIRVRVDTIEDESVSSSTYERMQDSIKAKDSHSVKQIIVDSRTQVV
eukprot:scaffold1138_cov128-Cylindrotheca_fusiformis.AAC.39